MKQFWHDNITEKSFKTLQELKHQYDFILIGGWAIYLWSKKMKSKDIDIVINYSELGKLQEKYTLEKNTRLHKYEVKLREFDIDIYLPHFSQIGFPLENLGEYTQNLEGFKVPQIEVLLFLKLYAYSQRQNSIKGEKDKIDIISLLHSVDIDWGKFSNLCEKYNKELTPLIKSILKNTRKVDELGLNDSQMSRLKKEILGSLEG